MITLEAKMKISCSLAILNISNSKHKQFLPFDKYAGIACSVALTQTLIVLSNVCCSADKLICFSSSVVIVRAQINISVEDTGFPEKLSAFIPGHMYR